MDLQEQRQRPNRETVTQIIRDLLSTYEPLLSECKINLESDLDTVNTDMDQSMIESASRALLQNAIDGMPNGGELSVTLVNGPKSWELEVADNSPQIPTATMPRAATANRKLEIAKQIVKEQGGQFESWNCPLGGVAHVLVIPQYKARNKRPSN